MTADQQRVRQYTDCQHEVVAPRHELGVTIALVVNGSRPALPTADPIGAIGAIRSAAGQWQTDAA